MKPLIDFRAVGLKPASAKLGSGYRGLAVAATLALCAPWLASSGEAQSRGQLPSAEAPYNSRSISMGVGKSVIVDLPRDAAEVVVGNPAVVNAVVRTPRKIYILGAGQGQTTIFAVDSQGRQFANYEVSVGRDVGELSPLLKAALPRSEIVPRTVNETIILTGSVTSPGDAQKAVDIAKGFAARAGAAAGGGAIGTPAEGGVSVVNALVIRGEDQVMLKVTVAEVSREVLKQLGFSAQAGGENLLNGSWGTLHVENPFAVNATLSSSALTFNGPTGSNTTATLKAFERYSVAHILAEPSVTAVSGEQAKVVVGGEIAVPSTSSCTIIGTAQTCVPGITFKPYGITLSFTPVVQSEGRILIHLSTEVTEVDLTNTQSYQGTSIPGFKTRKNDATVELPSGGSMATAGLLENRSAAAINGLPGLLNLPVLGALFRSRDYAREETELLVIVTPYVVKPVSPHEVVRPDDNFAEASDPQAWLLGRVNRIYATRSNPDLNKNFRGRIGFIHD